MSHDEDTKKGVLKPGDLFTLGWSYYEERNWILRATVGFNLSQALKYYWMDVRDKLVTLDGKSQQVGSSMDLRDGFSHFVMYLEFRGLAENVEPVIQILEDGSTGSTPFRDLYAPLMKNEDGEVIPGQPVNLLWDTIAKFPLKEKE